MYIDLCGTFGWQNDFVYSDVVVIINIRRKTQLTGDRRTILRFPPCSPKQPCGRLVLSPLRQRWKDGKANWRGWHCTFTLNSKQSFRFQGNPERQWNFQDTETSRKNNSLSIQEICNNKKLDFIHFKDDNIYLVTFTDMNTASKLLR